jgi:hypothetical protein
MVTGGPCGAGIPPLARGRGGFVIKKPVFNGYKIPGYAKTVDDHV